MAKRDLQRLWHRAIGTKEVQGSRRTQPAAVEQRGQTVDAGPVVGPLDQVVQHWVGSGVGQLIQNGIATHEFDDAGLL